MYCERNSMIKDDKWHKYQDYMHVYQVRCYWQLLQGEGQLHTYVALEYGRSGIVGCDGMLVWVAELVLA